MNRNGSRRDPGSDTMSANELVPITKNERIDLVDVLRGLAICGILLGNMQWFSGYGMMPPRVIEQSWSIADQLIHFLVHLFVEGKFYSIFSFLFGFGFAIQIERAEERGDSNASLFKRRLFWLLVIGLLHAYLLWAGDILSIYALTGFLLLLFRKKSDKFLLKWAAWLLFAPVPFYILLYILFVSFAPPSASDLSQQAAAVTGWNLAVAEVSQGTYLQTVTGFNLRYVAFRYIGLVAEMRIPKLLAMFLLGFYAYRSGFFQNLSQHREFILRIMKYGLVLGLIGNGVLAGVMWVQPLFPPSAIGIAAVMGYAIGVPSMALFYIAAGALLWQKPAAQGLLSYLAPVGRMALTNYLMQTVICVLIFYGYGFGFYGSVTAAPATMIALSIFAFQVAMSTVWLRYFQYGPMEWLWRQLTYRRLMSLRPSI